MKGRGEEEEEEEKEEKKGYIEKRIVKEEKVQKNAFGVGMVNESVRE